MHAVTTAIAGNAVVHGDQHIRTAVFSPALGDGGRGRNRPPRGQARCSPHANPAGAGRAPTAQAVAVAVVVGYDAGFCWSASSDQQHGSGWCPTCRENGRRPGPSIKLLSCFTRARRVTEPTEGECCSRPRPSGVCLLLLFSRWFSRLDGRFEGPKMLLN
jgi:hypothetical protein